MRLRTASMALATALVATVSTSTAQAGMNNINVNPGLASPRVPDVRPRPLTIDANIRLNCYTIRERNELGVWVRRTHCN
jgi:hypothetical protein